MKKYLKYLLAIVVGMINILSIHANTLTQITKDNTLLVPLRVISQELNAQVDFNNKTQTITITDQNNHIQLKVNSKESFINGKSNVLGVAPIVLDGTSYVPLRFIGEALGANIAYQNNQVTITKGDIVKTWALKNATSESKVSKQSSLKQTSTSIQGKKVNYIVIDMNDPKLQVKVSTAGNKINQATSLKAMSESAKATAGINGTYFAAYNGDMPLPDGTVVKNGQVLHITDIGCTIGFTPDNKVLIDFVQTRVQGYINGEEGWLSYRVNRPTPDPSATVIFTPEYVGNIPLSQGQVGVVCQHGKVIQKNDQASTVPQGGFILVMDANRANKFNIGDQVHYHTKFTPQNTSQEAWANVTEAISAGPSLLVNGKTTSAPSQEGFTEAKILTQTAQRSFIGTTADHKLIMGTSSANITDMKSIAKALGLVQATCLDGGASSGMYYQNAYIHAPGRNINNSLQFIYSK